MADNVNVTAVVSRPNWGAIWGGVFTFLGIWTVWGLLEMGVFFSSANLAVPAPVRAPHWGIAIWSAILTIVALFFAGRVTGHLSGFVGRRDSAVLGMITFGLSMVSSIVVVALLGRTALPVIIPGSYYVTWLHAGATLGYSGFLGTFLGLLATMWGVSIGTHSFRETAIEEPGARRAA